MGTTVERLLPRPAGCGNRLLAIGAPAGLRRVWRRAGWRVETHALDLGPAADLAGRPFSPPVKAWPQATAAYDAVVLYDQLAHVVDDEAALVEALRVLRPGGRLLIRVPRAGPLAWLDSYNVYRYLRDVTKRGPSPEETRGIGWRRHYPPRDLARLLGDHGRVVAVATEGIGLTDLARLVPLIFFRWLLRWDRGYALSRPLIDLVASLDSRLSAGPFGYHVVLAAERTINPPTPYPGGESCPTKIRVPGGR